MSREHESAEDPEGLGAAKPSPRAGDSGKPDDGTVDSTARAPESETDRGGAEPHTDINRQPQSQVAADGSTAQRRSRYRGRHSRKRESQARRRWKEWSRKTWGAIGLAIITAVGGWLAVWMLFVVGPPAPATSTPTPIGDPGHAPGRPDVSTLSLGHRFYAVLNFYYFQKCGRPCWQPLYQMPSEGSAGLTQGWPCEYYDPASAAGGQYCLKPPPGRTASEMADAHNVNSGDRILVFCQVTHIGSAQAQLVQNQEKQASRIWDMIALPRSRLAPNDVLAGKLSQVPGMPGFYEAYAPDIWLGNTGWHDIPCK